MMVHAWETMHVVVSVENKETGRISYLDTDVILLALSEVKVNSGYLLFWRRRLSETTNGWATRIWYVSSTYKLSYQLIYFFLNLWKLYLIWFSSYSLYCFYIYSCYFCLIYSNLNFSVELKSWLLHSVIHWRVSHTHTQRKKTKTRNSQCRRYHHQLSSSQKQRDNNKLLKVLTS